MTDNNFTTTILVDKSPSQTFQAITNPRGWWCSTIEGQTDRLGEVWFYRYKDKHFSTHKTTELVPCTKVVWHVLDETMTLPDRDLHDWRGTDIVFDMTRKGGKTEVCFTHAGLAPSAESYEMCKPAWTGLIQNSLRKLIETGQGEPV